MGTQLNESFMFCFVAVMINSVGLNLVYSYWLVVFHTPSPGKPVPSQQQVHPSNITLPILLYNIPQQLRTLSFLSLTPTERNIGLMHFYPKK